MSNGWIKLYRELLDKPIWKFSTPEQKSILITLLLLASHEPNEWEWKGEKFTVQSGQFVTSLESLAKKTGVGISVQNVRTCIHRFEKLEFLTNKSTKCGRLISIINWDTYQPNQKVPNKDVDKGVTKAQHMSNTYQECKKGKNDKKDPKYLVHFELFWNAFADKQSKQPAIKSWNQITDLTEKLCEKIIEGAKRYALERKNILTKGGTPKMAQGWLTDRRWEDEIILQPSKPLTEAEKKAHLFNVYLQDEAQQNESSSRPSDVIDIENGTETANPIIGALPGERTDG